jgi:glycosyltransferase involved in cell wall biosynthesis
LKIVQVSPFFSRIGGSTWYCQQLSIRLAERGHEVHVITSRFNDKLPFNEEKNGLHIKRYNCAGILWGINPLTFIMNGLMTMKADVVHAHSYIFLTSNQVALNKKLTGLPFLLHLHGGIDYSLPTKNLSTSIKFQVKKLYDYTVGRWTIQQADKVASVSKIDLKIAKNLWNLNSKNLHWIPNAIKIDDFSRNDNHSLNVTFIGRLESWKGIEVFLEIAKLIKKERDDVNIFIVGDGSLRKYVETTAFSFNGIIFGLVPHEKIPTILSKTSVLVLPSYTEGLPTVCLEALASEVPVVASNVGGISEVVLDGETGYLVSQITPHLFAEKVLKLLANEPLRNKMGKRGRKLVEQFYNWNYVVEKTEKIYETIGELI